jgi:dTDP-4-dehydrorhamnose 3,5-epimerase-like enzyme
MSNRYAPEMAATLRYNDPALAIPWPLKLADISRNDAAAPTLNDLDFSTDGLHR